MIGCRAHASSFEVMSHTPHRLRFELILGSLLLGFGLFALPGMIYWVGSHLLGPYKDAASAETFYGDFFGHLAEGSLRAWALVLGPLLIISLVRLIFLRRPIPETEEDTTPRSRALQAEQRRPATRSSEQEQQRREPRVTLD